MPSSPLFGEFQKLRAEKIGHTIVSNAVDRPWSQYFCCMVAGSTDYVNKYPAGDQTCPARHPQVRRLLRVGPEVGGAGSWSIEAFCPATTMR